MARNRVRQICESGDRHTGKPVDRVEGHVFNLLSARAEAAVDKGGILFRDTENTQGDLCGELRGGIMRTDPKFIPLQIMHVKNTGIIPGHPVRDAWIEGCDDLESFKRSVLEFPASVYRGKGHVTADESEIDASLFEGTDIPGGARGSADVQFEGGVSILNDPGDRFSDRVHGPAAVGSSDRQDF